MTLTPVQRTEVFIRSLVMHLWARLYTFRARWKVEQERPPAGPPAASEPANPQSVVQTGAPSSA